MCTIFTIIISESKLSEIAMSFQILFSSYIILLFFDKYLILCKEGSGMEGTLDFDSFNLEVKF